MKLGESINTYNPTLALRRENGIFHVTTPGGEEITVTCKPGESMAAIEWADPENKRPFLVTKISEPATFEGRTALRQVG